MNQTCKAVNHNDDDCALPTGHRGEFHCDADGYCWGTSFQPGERVVIKGGRYPGTVLFTTETVEGYLTTTWAADGGPVYSASTALLRWED